MDDLTTLVCAQSPPHKKSHTFPSPPHTPLFLNQRADVICCVYTFTKRSKGMSEGTLGLNINLLDAAGKFGDSPLDVEWTQ